MRRTLLTARVAALGLAAVPGAVRAGGFEIAAQGPRAAGRAGAFTVRADDVSAIDYNPAGLARVRGTRFLMANRFTYANEEFRRASTLDWSDAAYGIPRLVSFDHVTNALPFQPLGPMLGVATDFGLDDWGFALGVYAPPGTSSQRFPRDGAQKYMLVEREVMVVYYTASAAWKYKDLFGFGASLQWVDLPKITFDLIINGNTSPRMVEPEQSRFDVENRITGSDRVNFTGILGGWYKPWPFLEVAASARILPVNFRAKSHMTVVPLNLQLEEPPKLTRDGQPDDTVTFSMSFPVKLRAGARYVHERNGVELFDVELDLGWEQWSVVDSFTMDAAGLITEVLGQPLEPGVIQMPRNWKDTWSVRVGGDWNALPEWLSLRGGFLFETGATPKGYEYIDVLSFLRFGPSAGFTVHHWGFDLSAAYTWIFQMPSVVTEDQSRVYQQMPGSLCTAPYTDTQNCNVHYLGQPAAAANAGTWLSDYHFVSVGLGYGF